MKILKRIKNKFQKLLIGPETWWLTRHVKDPRHRDIYRGIIKNQLVIRNAGSIFESAVAKLLPKLAVKVLDEIIILDDIVGFQPMSGPVGIVYKLRYTTSEENRLSLEILKQTIEAGTRKLQARFALEAKQDLRNMHGKNLEAEITNALASEIACEIISEILNELSVDDDALPRTEHVNITDEQSLAQFICMINQRASKIAMASRRGAGNVLVVSPAALTYLQSCEQARFVQTTDPKPEGFQRIRYVGTALDQYKVYCDTFAERDVIVTYRGSSPTDVGLIYSPYVLLLSTGVVMNPVTFEPLVSFMTRYSKHIDDRMRDYSRAFDVKSSAEEKVA